MISLAIVIILMAVVGAGLWMIFRFSDDGAFKKETYHRTPAPRRPDKKRHV